MIILDYLISAVWLSPFAYLLLMLLGKLFNRTLKSDLIKQKGDVEKKVDKIIYEIPTVGNYKLVNGVFEEVKNYNLPVPLETWAVVEERDIHKDQYVCDRVVVVPKDFECEDLYKARALEYARRLRKKLVDEGELSLNYVLLEGDDDSLPSHRFIQESLKVDADISTGSITPKIVGAWNTILEYERCIACAFFCNFFTNIGQPLFAHGDGMVISSKADQNVSYDTSTFNKNFRKKLVNSEDGFYLHKAAVMGFRVFNSEEPVYILPPLTVSDAVKQRRRWLWGQWELFSQKMLPLQNRLRLGILMLLGFCIYSIATLGLPLNYLGIIHIQEPLLPAIFATVIIWFGMRAYIIGNAMGWKHGVMGCLLSYVTVTLNFLVQVTGLLKGNPRNFEVIRKE